MASWLNNIIQEKTDHDTEYEMVPLPCHVKEDKVESELSALSLAEHRRSDAMETTDFQTAEEPEQCGSCFRDFHFDDLLHCTDGHLVCINCLEQHTKEQRAQGKTKWQCMVEDCEAEYAMLSVDNFNKDQHHDTIAEAVTPHDTISEAVTPHDTISEAITPHDTISEAVTPHDTIAEAVTPHDTIAEAVTPHDTIAEAATPHDTTEIVISPSMEDLEQCGNCFKDFHFDDLVICFEGHIVCVQCYHRYAQEESIQEKSKLQCMVEDCEAEYPISPPNALKKIDEQHETITEAVMPHDTIAEAIDTITEAVTPHDTMTETDSSQEYFEDTESEQCGSCYRGFKFEDLLICFEGHVVCVDCYKREVNDTELKSGKSKWQCIVDDCEGCYMMTVMQGLLSPNTLHKSLRCRCCGAEVVRAPDAETCVCQNEDCEEEWCVACGKRWNDHDGKRCEEVENYRKSEKLPKKVEKKNIRVVAEERMTEAIIRYCPNCNVGLVSTECNLVTCTCGTTICYVCRKPDVQYAHFCFHARTPGKPCQFCKIHCSLWASTEVDDERTIKEIRQNAIEELESRGFIGTQVGAPDTPPMTERNLFHYRAPQFV